MSDLQHLEEDKNILLGFLQDSSRRKIATGKTADKEVTADSAREVGCKVLGNMEGQNVADHPKEDDVPQAFC